MTQFPTPDPISLQDWLSQKAQISLTELSHSIPEITDSEAESRFLRFFFSSSENALLSLTCIRQVMKVQPQGLLRVPDMPAFIAGIYNFHGEMLWMVDLGLQLGFQGVTVDRSTFSPSFPFSSSPFLLNGMAIVIQAHGKSLGLLVPQIIDIESHDSTQLSPATSDLFPSNLLPFVQGYVVRSNSPILDANALIADRRLQVHAA